MSSILAPCLFLSSLFGGAVCVCEEREIGERDRRIECVWRERGGGRFVVCICICLDDLSWLSRDCLDL